MNINKEEWLKEIEKRIERDYFKTIGEATQEQLLYSFTRQILGLVWQNWAKTKKVWEEAKCKVAYYLSAEFLMGRWLGNAMINLGAQDGCRKAMDDLGFDYNAMEEAEADAGLGNGGLGRLAACFLDSLATLNLPAMGYGIRYRYGMFEQRIINGYQMEFPDNWLKDGDAASIARPDHTVPVEFGGEVSIRRDEAGQDHFFWDAAEVVNAVPYDMPVVGYKTKTVLTLRLWQAESPDGFDLELFQNEEYQRAVERANAAENISRVLYPNDRGPSGKTLRLRQQFFFVSASLQDILRRYKRVWGQDMGSLPDSFAIQLNDTHPVIAIPELMRLLMDQEGLPWEEAWSLTIRCCAYTNHTIMAEALEKWPIDIFNALLPRHYLLIEEINRRFLSYLRQLHPNDFEAQSKMSIISNGVVNMAWLAIIGSHSVNGVAALHTELLKTRELKMWYEVFPEKFNNKTNGVTQRRWLLKANPGLASLISHLIGDAWITDLGQLEQLKRYADDTDVLTELMLIKKENKRRLAAYIQSSNHIEVEPEALFDVQVKRLHEYKRQLLGALHIVYLYQRLKENPDFDLVPRVFIFGAKAASGYKQAKLIIKFINAVADMVNGDMETNGKLKAVFLENYRVSLAEKIFPAADLSEQISTAGYEASGTGNMKFMMNGALTIGTLDGANIEIMEAAGRENAFIFGLTAQEVHDQAPTYNPQELLVKDAQLAAVVEAMLQKPIAKDGLDLFRDLYNSLLYGIDGNSPDRFFVLRDFRAYVEAQENAGRLYKDSLAWAKAALLNIANSGRFSSDRTVQEYAKDIWGIKPIHF